MGLDISVYKNISVCSEEEASFVAYVLSDKWKHKIKNLEYGSAYKGEYGEGEVSYAYSTHSRFREYLVSLTNNSHLLDENGRIKWGALTQDIPFIDLIDFADNEGCLDWETAKRLLKDFDKYSDCNKENKDHYLQGKFDDWHEVVRSASDNGVIVFH